MRNKGAGNEEGGEMRVATEAAEYTLRVDAVLATKPIRYLERVDWLDLAEACLDQAAIPIDRQRLIMAQIRQE